MSDLEQPAFELTIAGRKIDGRTVEARRFRALGGDLMSQLARNPTAAERMLILNAATLAMLCERASADLIEGRGSMKRITAATSRCSAHCS
jgi:hypothetical protein